MTIRTDTTGWELATPRLTVRVAKPGFLYQRTRFDWTGMVTDVWLDQQHSFCSVESPNPLVGAGGIGLCGEFGIHEPVGYAEAPIGTGFPKIGVGNLTKEDAADYFFMRPYPCEPYPCTVATHAAGLVFTQSPLPCNGYAVHYVKTITVSDNRLHMVMTLHNTGSKPIETTEYNHNFLQIDKTPVGSAYRLLLSAALPLTRQDGSIWSSDGTLTWPNGEAGFYGVCNQIPAADSFQWTLHNRLTGASVRERVDFHPLRFACWGMPHVISPEVFRLVRLQPGEITSWTREWTFSGE